MHVHFKGFSMAYPSHAMLQAVYGAFARFRAHHRLRANTSPLDGQPAVAEAETAAVSMLQHVSATAGADDIAPGGLRSLPSQQSDMPSLASAEAQQGSADRSAVLASAQLKATSFGEA